MQKIKTLLLMVFIPLFSFGMDGSSFSVGSITRQALTQLVLKKTGKVSKKTEEQKTIYMLLTEVEDDSYKITASKDNKTGAFESMVCGMDHKPHTIPVEKDVFESLEKAYAAQQK